jgi:hypothetical protein
VRFNKFKSLLIVFILVLILAKASLVTAGTFSLKTVGSLNVDGIPYNHLWYTNGGVTFTGTSLENAQITATVDGAASTVTADASGNWSYGASLADGDHDINFTADGSSISFVLTIGQDIPENVGALSPPETPTAGIISPTIAILLGGFVLILTPFLLKKLAAN